MKMFKKLVNVAVALAMVAMPALATEVAKAATPVSITGTPTSLVVTREVEGVTNPVRNTFTYQVVAADTNPATATNLPANFTIQFDGSEPIVNNKATKTTDLDMSGIVFPEVGDYEFIVKEIGSTDTTTYKIDHTEWYTYVSVRYITEDGTVGGTPTANMEAKLAPSAKAGNAGTKQDIVFNSSAEFTNLLLSTSVTGNLADINEYFKYTIDFINGDVADGTTFKVLGAHSTDGGTTTVTSSDMVIQGGKADIWLKHGQSVTIGLTAQSNGYQQVPVGVEYELTEFANGYRIYVDGDTRATNNEVTVEKSTVNTGNSTSFVNNKEAEPITGFFVNYWPFILLIVLGITGAIIFKKTSKKANR